MNNFICLLAIIVMFIVMLGLFVIGSVLFFKLLFYFLDKITGP